MPSPCSSRCQAKGGLCVGCGRTLTEITRWSSMDERSQLAVMAELEGTKSTHSCPGCGNPTYCAVSAGEPISHCWCSQLTALPLGEASACWCRHCLSNRIGQEP
ncbi:DUF1289 domain-containing protein [Aeromonas cavernicola]|uniref:DUF1289 domain-containing protein n=1 Tax=Aeromonas cavernicola TaxID=1006623 RepID=A0A2H9U377_9GAMM|nr:DUF1289 domain-containing protein [Aeromonas cavernicola]PJG58506.1 DUF1289 domain-containing protein [Aeromonas cavernicola]